MSDALEIVASSWYQLELQALPEAHRDRIIAKVLDCAAKGWSASMSDETIKHLQDGIYELRILGRGAAFRLLFFVVPGRQPRLVVLTTCAAKSRMTKRQQVAAEITRATARRAAWMEAMNRKEEARGR